MTDREKIIEGLEMSYKHSNVDEYSTLVSQQLILDVIAMLKEQEAVTPTVGGWISVKDRLPEQTPSLFSQFKDTDKWSKAMWVIDSETVLVTVAAKGESIVTTGKLQDGKWCTRISPVIEYKVTHWMPMPEPPKEDKP